jgi:hypothetical protein
MSTARLDIAEHTSVIDLNRDADGSTHVNGADEGGGT